MSENLQAANPDTLYLSNEVTDRFRIVVDRHHRTHGTPPPMSEEFKSTCKRWRTMHYRFQQGDYRHTRSELLALRDVAQWTLDVNNTLCNQTMVKMEWQD